MVVGDGGAVGELLVELITLGVSYHKIVVGGAHPFGKRIGHRLRQRFRMGCPREYHLGALHFFKLFYGDEVGKRLQRVNSGGFHRKHRATRIFHKLVEDALFVVVALILELGKRPNAYHVAITAHHRYGFQQVLALVAVHHHSALGFQFPCALVHIKHYHVHTQIHSGLLSAQACTQTRIKKHHQQRFVFAQTFIGKPIPLHFKGLCHSGAQIANIAHMLKYFHILYNKSNIYFQTANLRKTNHNFTLFPQKTAFPPKPISPIAPL